MAIIQLCKPYLAHIGTERFFFVIYIEVGKNIYTIITFQYIDLSLVKIFNYVCSFKRCQYELCAYLNYLSSIYCTNEVI